jgi:acetoin utilization deacetylase AcuC-like enzyme
MGFCIFNNVGVGAMHARAKYDLARIAIVDFDVHHGNGTQVRTNRSIERFLLSTFVLVPFVRPIDNANGVLNIDKSKRHTWVCYNVAFYMNRQRQKTHLGLL